MPFCAKFPYNINELPETSMFHARDCKTGSLFDKWAYMGPRRRKLLDDSWAGLFRKEILPELPREKLAPPVPEDDAEDSSPEGSRRRPFSPCTRQAGNDLFRGHQDPTAGLGPHLLEHGAPGAGQDLRAGDPKIPGGLAAPTPGASRL